jgi:hypothetical protein
MHELGSGKGEGFSQPLGLAQALQGMMRARHGCLHSFFLSLLRGEHWDVSKHTYKCAAPTLYHPSIHLLMVLWLSMDHHVSLKSQASTASSLKRPCSNDPPFPFQHHHCGPQSLHRASRRRCSLLQARRPAAEAPRRRTLARQLREPTRPPQQPQGQEQEQEQQQYPMPPATTLSYHPPPKKHE